MTNEPILHADTRLALERLAARPPHAILLTGPAGIGKSTAARWLAASILDIPNDKLADYPQLLTVNSIDNKAISIEAVRQLEHFIALKTASQRPISRIVLIDGADLLGDEAQNALLKTLEEPPADTVLILTSPQASALLPTIRSRVQTIDIIVPPNDLLADQFAQLPAARRNQLLALSGGLPGLAFAMADDDTSHPLVVAAATARQLLQASTFERLAAVDKLTKDKQRAGNVLDILMQMAHGALLTGRSTQRWQKVLSASYDASEALASNVQPKLVLTNLMLNL